VKKLPPHWIEYVANWYHEPMAFWVHRSIGSGKTTTFDPPAPPQIGRKGFAVLCVESGRFVFRYSSLEQLDECVRVLSLKPLPTSRHLSLKRGASVGPNSHWLSRLPASIKTPKMRARCVEDLVHIRTQIAKWLDVTEK
jgi:hypothetical protein